MATKDWKFDGKSKSGQSWSRKRGSGWVYLYNKGWFRDREESIVISTSSTGGSNPQDRIDESFRTKSEAIKYARDWMERN